MEFFNNAVTVLQTLVVALGAGHETVNGRRRRCPYRHNSCSASDWTVWIRKSQVISMVILGGGEKPPLHTFY